MSFIQSGDVFFNNFNIKQDISESMLLTSRSFMCCACGYNEQNFGQECNTSPSTLQPLYNKVHYNTVLDITGSKDGSQKCIDYIEK